MNFCLSILPLQQKKQPSSSGQKNPSQPGKKKLKQPRTSTPPTHTTPSSSKKPPPTSKKPPPPSKKPPPTSKKPLPSPQPISLQKTKKDKEIEQLKHQLEDEKRAKEETMKKLEQRFSSFKSFFFKKRRF